MPFPKLTAKTFDSIRELNGISKRTMEEHYALYQAYVNKTNEVQEKLNGVDRGSANQIFSDLRSLRVDLSFAIGGVKAGPLISTLQISSQSSPYPAPNSSSVHAQAARVDIGHAERLRNAKVGPLLRVKALTRIRAGLRRY